MIRQTLGAFALAGGLLCAAADIEIRQPGYIFQVDNGQAVIRDAAGNRLLQLGDLRIGWGAPQSGIGVSAERIGNDRVKISYETKNDPTGKVSFGAVYTVKPERIDAEYTLTAPKRINVGGTQLTVRPLDATRKGKELYKSGLWTEHAGGGVPFEVRDGYFRPFNGKASTLWMLVTGNHSWNDHHTQHLNFKKRDKDSDTYVADASFFVTPPNTSGTAAAARFHGRPVALTLSTGRDFNLFETGNIPAELKLALANTSGRELRNITLTVSARDYDGSLPLDRRETVTLAPGEEKEYIFPLPAGKRELYFAEAAATVDGRRYFTRTNVAALPPHRFEHKDRSIFGIAAFFPTPSREAALALLNRLGVHHLRHDDNRKLPPEYGMIAFAHSNVKRTQWPDPEQRRRELDKLLAGFDAAGNPIYEFGNEWNMSTKGKSTGDAKKREAAQCYADWYKTIDQVRKENGRKVKIYSLGLAGQDTGFLKLLKEFGAYDLLDGIAFHPGRGNQTPDNPRRDWNYIGTIRAYRKLVKELGDKPLIITEAYAATHPNDWWKDSYRQSGDNILLTLALALAEGMESVQVYQLNDSTWHDIGGVNPKDVEYHYGMLMRDLSLKPAAMAYAATAEELDGAKFLKYLEFKAKGDEEVKGMLFDTPRGDLAILYDRIDGYFQSRNTPDFKHAEPWVKAWPTERNHVFKAAGGEVTVIDSIGRARKIPAADGKVTLKLSGSPVMVYGLDLR